MGRRRVPEERAVEREVEIDLTEPGKRKVTVSQSGKELARSISVQPMEIFRGALAVLSADDVEHLVRILGKLQRWVRERVAVDDGTRTDPPRPPRDDQD